MTECYECSRLAELVAQNSQMRVKLGMDAPEKPVGALGRLADAMNEPISRFNAQESGETAENGASKCEMRDFDDSREKLEADVRKHYSHTTSTLMYPPSANKQTDWLAPMPMDTVFGWLDRQAAITERECRKPNWEYCETCELEAENARLREAVGDFCAELQMGLDALKGKAAAIKGSL